MAEIAAADQRAHRRARTERRVSTADRRTAGLAGVPRRREKRGRQPIPARRCLHAVRLRCADVRRLPDAEGQGQRDLQCARANIRLPERRGKAAADDRHADDLRDADGIRQAARQFRPALRLSGRYQCRRLNFDGHDDFGVQTGHEGSYGGPSYDVYVFDPNGGKFILNDAMSELTRSSLGFFDVDTKNKRLRTLGKSGCCYHETTVYRVERNRPVAVERHIEDGMRGDGRMAITDERLINGKWQRKVRYLSQ
ncbi:XAC2610-related protein [Burkholderia ubonensis]|uniref:XAC2610-related protein n=1 Tax=Burkholderia ubonensis TaxID=101571 RepID=UPI0039F4BD21